MSGIATVLEASGDLTMLLIPTALPAKGCCRHGQTCRDLATTKDCEPAIGEKPQGVEGKPAVEISLALTLRAPFARRRASTRPMDENFHGCVSSRARGLWLFEEGMS